MFWRYQPLRCLLSNLIEMDDTWLVVLNVPKDVEQYYISTQEEAYMYSRMKESRQRQQRNVNLFNVPFVRAVTLAILHTSFYAVIWVAGVVQWKGNRLNYHLACPV